MAMDLTKTLVSHLKFIAAEIFHQSECPRTLLVYDEDTPLAKMVSAAYRTALPVMAGINFSQTTPENILEAFEKLSSGDLVILVQSTSFRLDAFRIRVHLFERGLKVIEHPHLGRVREEEYETYVNSLAYDQNYYRQALKEHASSRRKENHK